MVRRFAVNGARASCVDGKIDGAADRGAVGKRTRQFEQLVAKRLGGLGTVDDGPVDHHLLVANSGPFLEQHADAAIKAGADRLEHTRIGDRHGIAVALQLEFGLIDAARYIRRQHQQQIDRLGRARCRRAANDTPRRIAAKRNAPRMTGEV